jgi:tetratricopeptide (TPR) repeat protein
MKCPVCQQALIKAIEKPILSKEVEHLISNLPYVIAYPLKRAITEKHAWTKINLLKDTFLNYLKYLGLITATEFFNSDLKDKKMVALFHATLAEPSFGTWNLYIRETIAYLNQNNHRFFCPELPGYYETIETGKKRKLYKGEIEFIDGNGDVQLKKQEATAIGMLINFRNRYLGHGLTLDEDASKKLWDEYYPMFNQLLTQLNFPIEYPMFKHEHGETYLLQSNELSAIEKGNQISASVWMENPARQTMDILPFFIVPGELALTKEDKEQLLTYESYTGKTIKFFSPEGTEKQTSGKILEKLNLLLRDKQKEQPYSPESFTKEVFLQRIADENKLTLDTLIAEKKYIPGVYVHREEMEIKLREWIGARSNIFFIAAEAGSGKTNLLLEIQQQYAAQNLPVIFIRAARMDKPSLQGQIAHLLNIQPELGIEDYTSISGTQASPTFILIDGLNEAVQGESLWQEILEISKKSTPGSLKFVVSSRANTSADLNRYPLVDVDEVYLYGEKKEGHTELSAFAFWLTALNMSEMKSAWEAYGQTNKNKYKPQFSFDDIATFDRGIYNLISNPLVLRIFLETYHNKPLPKKGNKHLNIWQDWLSTFSFEEIAFLKNLAQAVWEKGENELLLDDLLNNPKLNSFLTTDLINAPYPRLKNLGWISRYVKDFNACLSFTVEGALLYLLGSHLHEQTSSMDFDAISSLLKTGTKIQQSAVESYLCLLAINDDLRLVCELIDGGQEYHKVCDLPMLFYLRNNGVKLFIEKVFYEPTHNDWHAMLMLNNTLDDLEEHVLRKQLLEELIPLNTFSIKIELEFGLMACFEMDREQAQSYLAAIGTRSDLLSEDEKLLKHYGDVYSKFGQYDKALESYHRCLDIELKQLGTEHQDVANSLGCIANILCRIGKDQEALTYYQKCLDIHLKVLGEENAFVAFTYGNIGHILTRQGEYDKALEFYQKGLEIKMKILGAMHSDVAISYGNIGRILVIRSEFDSALTYHTNSMEIFLKVFGEANSSVATCYNNLGWVHESKGEYEKALDFYQKCLEIRLKTLGAGHPDLVSSYNKLGTIWVSKDEYDKALDFYEKCLEIEIKTLGVEHPDLAVSYDNMGTVLSKKGTYDKAIIFYQKCLDIQLKTLGAEHPDVAGSYFSLGQCYQRLEFYELAINAFKLGYGIYKKGGFPYQIAFCYEKLNNLEEAFNFYVQSAEIRKNDPNIGIEAKSTKQSITASKRLAVDLNKEDELPEWIKEINL